MFNAQTCTMVIYQVSFTHVSLFYPVHVCIQTTTNRQNKAQISLL